MVIGFPDHAIALAIILSQISKKRVMVIDGPPNLLCVLFLEILMGSICVARVIARPDLLGRQKILAQLCLIHQFFGPGVCVQMLRVVLVLYGIEQVAIFLFILQSLIRFL